MTATITGRYDFDAPAEVVFGVLTDPGRTTRWLPVGVTADAAGDHVEVRAGAESYAVDVRTEPDRLRVEWRPRDLPELRAAAVVRDAPAGGSVVDAEVDVPESTRARAEDLLAETMVHLRRDVADNFTAG